MLVCVWYFWIASPSLEIDQNETFQMICQNVTPSRQSYLEITLILLLVSMYHWTDRQEPISIQTTFKLNTHCLSEYASYLIFPIEPNLMTFNPRDYIPPCRPSIRNHNSISDLSHTNTSTRTDWHELTASSTQLLNSLWIIHEAGRDAIIFVLASIQ